MSLEQTLATIIREAVRDVVREELNAATRNQVQSEYLSASQAAKFAACSVTTVRNWMRDEEIEVHGKGRMRRVRAEDVRKLLVLRQNGTHKIEPAEEWAARQLQRAGG